MFAQIINTLREDAAVFRKEAKSGLINRLPILGLREEASVSQAYWNAVVASSKCRCGSRHCLACGMVKFVARVNRISERVHHAKVIT